MNEPVLENGLLALGVAIIDPETMDIGLQARMISEADMLISAWGSGLTLSPLLRGRRQVVELTPRTVGDAWFLRQAAVHDLRYLPIIHDAGVDGAIVADLPRIIALLRSLL